MPPRGPVLPYTGGQVYQQVRRKRSQQALPGIPPVSASGSIALAPLAFAGTATETITTAGSVALAPVAFSGTATVVPPPPAQPYTGGQVHQGARRRRSQQALPGLPPAPVAAGSVALAPVAFSGTVTVSPVATGSFALAPVAFSGTATETISATGSVALAPLAFSGDALGPTLPVQPYTGGQAYRAARRRRSQQALAGLPPVTSSGSFALAPAGFAGMAQLPPPPVAPYAGGQNWRLRQKRHRQQALATPPPTARGTFALAPLAFAGTIVTGFPFPQNLLSLRYEMLVNGTWTDITDYVYQRQAQVTTRGRPDETQTVQSAECNLTVNNRDGRFTPGNSNGAWYPFIGRNTQFRASLAAISTSGDAYTGYRFWGELSELPPSWDQSQSDVYVAITASGVLRRYQQGANIGSALRRYYSGLSGEVVPYAVWPAEDATGSTLIASLLSTVDPMTFSGSPDFASATAFGGSDAIAGVNSSSWHGETGAIADPPGTGDIVQVIPGTYTWICPPGVSTVDVEQATGAGGGGGDTDGTTGGSGAGGAGTSVSASVGVTAGTAYTYVVPAAGAAGSGGPGTDGDDATWAGDSVTVTGHGGAGGGYAGAAGGDGGAGTYSGGDGAAGQDNGPSSGSMTLSGYTGATGTGTGTTEPAAGDSQSQEWVCPPGVDTVAVKAGAAGGGGTLDGGGGAGFSSGSIDTTPGNTYIFQAGNGGNGGSFSGGKYGNDGGDSYVDGDSSSSVTAGGGGGGGFGGAPGSGGSGDNEGASGSSWSYTSVDFEDEAYDQEVSGGGGGGASSGTDGAAPTANTDSPFTFGYTGGVYGGGAGGFWTNFDDLSGGSSAGTSNPGTSAAGGGGGASTPDGTNYTGGLGGGPGWITWSWTGTDVPVGGGGGGSGGTGADGNAGSTEGTGGIAVTGGGAGGGQGSAGSAPGGGGGGAVPAYGPNAAVPAGNGGAGKIAFSWDGGETSPVAADIVRFLLDVPPGGETDGVVLVQFVTYSDDVTTVDVVYHTGGDLELIGYNSSSDQVFDSGSKSFGVDGQPVMVEVQLISDGSDIEWSLSAIEPGAGLGDSHLHRHRVRHRAVRLRRLRQPGRQRGLQRDRVDHRADLRRPAHHPGAGHQRVRRGDRRGQARAAVRRGRRHVHPRGQRR